MHSSTAAGLPGCDLTFMSHAGIKGDMENHLCRHRSGGVGTPMPGGKTPQSQKQEKWPCTAIPGTARVVSDWANRN